MSAIQLPIDETKLRQALMIAKFPTMYTLMSDLAENNINEPYSIN